MYIFGAFADPAAFFGGLVITIVTITLIMVGWSVFKAVVGTVVELLARAADWLWARRQLVTMSAWRRRSARH